MEALVAVFLMSPVGGVSRERQAGKSSEEPHPLSLQTGGTDEQLRLLPLSPLRTMRGVTFA